MRTVAIINQKGGCGKTTTSINLAACLARLGHKTLLVDMDPQGHCGIGLAVPEDQIERTIYDAMIEERDGKVAKLSEIVWQIASDFDLAPSTIKLAAFEQVFAGRGGREDRLLNALAPVQDSYEWCIIDCPPSVGLITFNALRACDEVIVPVETGFFSLHGLTKMMETLEVLRERCSKEITIRVLPTLYDTRTKLAREVLAELRAKFRDYLMESTVNFNTKLKEAASFGQPITEYDPGSRGYKDFVNLARELMGHRPADVEPVTNDNKLSRPAELVQRAKQLAQLTNFQFGRNATQVPGEPALQQQTPVIVPSFATPPAPPEPSREPVLPPRELREQAFEAAVREPLISETTPEPIGSNDSIDSIDSIESTESLESVETFSNSQPAITFGGSNGSATSVATAPSPTTTTTATPLPAFMPNPRMGFRTAFRFASQQVMQPVSQSIPASTPVAEPIAELAVKPAPAAPAPMLINRLDQLDLAPSHSTSLISAKLSTPLPNPSKTTEQKIEEFYGVKQIGEEVLFSARFSQARKVQIAGDFNNWSPMSTPMMTNGQPGVFKMSLPLKPGRYRYRFVVDGAWMTDPNNKYVEANQFGELNNIVEVD